MFSFIIYLTCLIGITIGDSIISDAIESCIDSNSHKKSPGKESSLYNQCAPWKDHSCCTDETSRSIHRELNNHNFNFDHCKAQTGQVMSQECRRHFVQDHCFYECEPNVKPWVVKTNRSFARERIYNVPLCASDCVAWWSQCKSDYTCAYNWAKDFDWRNKTNVCKEGSKCKPLSEMFTGAKEFCEMVWDNSWKYTSEEKPCMRMWFNGTVGNPNRQTAQYYASIGVNGVQHVVYSIYLQTIMLVTAVIIAS